MEMVENFNEKFKFIQKHKNRRRVSAGLREIIDDRLDPPLTFFDSSIFFCIPKSQFLQLEGSNFTFLFLIAEFELEIY